MPGSWRLAAAFPGETADALGRIPDRTWAIAFAAATLIVALALVDFLLANTVRWPAGVLSDRGVGRPPSTVDALVALNVAAVTAIALAGLDKLPRPDADALGAESARVRILATYDAGKVVDLVFRSEREGYVATDDTISRFVLPREPGGRFELHPVASVDHARGLAIAGDALFVSELGRLPCDPDPCEGYEFPGIATEAGDRRYLMQAHGRVEAFDVEADGSVSGRRVIVRDLPVANTLHAVNGVTAGPDGLLYLPIGNLDALYAHPGIALQLGVPRAGLLGTIVRFAPDGSRFEVLARGIRNVYDLTFDERGGLYGVDNNGPTPTAGARKSSFASDAAPTTATRSTAPSCRTRCGRIRRCTPSPRRDRAASNGEATSGSGTASSWAAAARSPSSGSAAEPRRSSSSRAT